MEHQTFTLKSHNQDFFAQCWQPEQPVAAALLVHGFGEHSARYEHTVVAALVNKGVAVVAYDNFGHGKSEGKRGHCPNYDALMHVLGKMLRKTEDLFPGLPTFLYGHSMGGNLVLNYVLRHQTHLKGVVATSPYLRLAFEPPKWKMMLGKLMLGILPSITLPAELEEAAISRDDDEVKKYKEDPLVHDKVSPMFSFPIMDAGEWAIANADKLTPNTLLLHGTEDRLIDHKATIAFHENTSVTTLELFEGGYHELHNDLDKEKMLDLVSDWVVAQLKEDA